MDHKLAIDTQNATLDNLAQILARIEKHTGSKVENSATDGELKKSEEVDIKPFQTQRDIESRERKVPSRASSRGFSISSIAPQETPPAVPDIPLPTYSATTSEASGDRLSDRDREHGTAAHKLLRWPSIKRMLDRRNSFSFREGFVVETEERRGTLRPYGQGYGLRQIDEFIAGFSSPAIGSPAAKFDDLGRPINIPSSAPWGCGGFGPREPRTSGTNNDHIGGLDTDGSLKMDPTTVHRLVNSYMAHIHVMQPFMDRKQLQHMIDSFISQKPPSTPRGWSNPYSPQVSGPKNDTMRDIPNMHGWNNGKRRYESPLAGIRPDVSPPLNQPIERSISNAVVLLVLALGKICEHNGPLPGPTDYRASRTNMSQACSPSDHHDSPHSGPIRSSSAVTTPSHSVSSAHSPMNDIRSNHGHSLYRGHPEKYNTAPVYPMSPSIQAAPNTSSGSYNHEHLQNVDKIPGLAYYAYASDILGNEHGGIEVQHVQARLLAGLYTGQLACVIESWQWIQSACVVCILLTREYEITFC